MSITTNRCIFGLPVCTAPTDDYFCQLAFSKIDLIVLFAAQPGKENAVTRLFGYFWSAKVFGSPA